MLATIWRVVLSFVFETAFILSKMRSGTGSRRVSFRAL
jgi:hypothetical protein